MNGRRSLVAATLLADALFVAGCARNAAPAATGADRLVVARSAEPVSLDPARATDIESLEVAEQVYGRLVRFAPGRLEPEPDLATSWSVSDDGTSWTFQLRPDVTFQDGTPVNAEAVVFSFERQLIPDHPAHEADFVWTRAFHNIRRVRAVTPLRVQFDIDRPYAPFLANLAMGPAAIVSPTAVRKLGSAFGRHPVGAGPYRFVEWIPGDRITLERNPTYWDRAARTRYLVLLVMPDSRQRLQALESGSADIVEQLAPDELPLVRLNPDLRLAMAPAALVSYLAMNTQKRPLDDPRIRRAIATAIRRDALVKLVYQGVGMPAIGPLPPNVWGARSDVVTYPYDPDRARKMLAEAGWHPTVPLKLYAPSTPTPYNPDPARVAAIIKTCLAEVGIPVEIVLNDAVEHQRALWAGEHDLALHGWFNDNGDPDNFLYTLLDSDNTTGSRPSNIAFYSNGWFHDVIGVAQRTTDRTERERLYSQAQAILATDVPWVPLAHSNVVFATRANVRGLVVQPSSIGLYRGVERVP
ncbi:MAG TPA: ABC transporter substrate-binding protein [Polyangia bacterium]|nr:ABC transporter substrate-binding protein [Polyangia bacterium]